MFNWKYFPGKLYASDIVFNFDIKPSEAMKCVKLHNRRNNDWGLFETLKYMYSILIGSIYIAVLCCIPWKGEGNVVDQVKNKLLSFMESVVKQYE